MVVPDSACQRPLAGRRLLALFAHPDDEVLAAGGTIARCTRLGAEVTVACATRGEAGSLAPGTAVRCGAGEELGRRRVAELADSCRVLGARPPQVLDLPDGRLAALDSEPQVQRLLALITAQAPHVLVTMGNDGAYGHCDHLAVTRWLQQAATRLDPCPRLLHAAFPARHLGEVWRALHRLPGVIDGEVTAAMLGAEREQVSLRVDIRGARQYKLAAIACYRSQLRDDDPLSFLRPGLLGALLEEEWFVHVAGPPLPAGAWQPFAGLGQP